MKHHQFQLIFPSPPYSKGFIAKTMESRNNKVDDKARDINYVDKHAGGRKLTDVLCETPIYLGYLVYILLYSYRSHTLNMY